MKLIAKKPCCFAGRKFYIGDEIPAEIVLDPIRQEKLGLLSLVDEEPEADEESAPVEESEPSAEKAATKKAPAKKGRKKPVEEAGER